MYVYIHIYTYIHNTYADTRMSQSKVRVLTHISMCSYIHIEREVYTSVYLYIRHVLARKKNVDALQRPKQRPTARAETAAAAAGADV